MKLNKYFTLCYSLYFNILHYPRVFTHLAPHLYFPFPTEVDLHLVLQVYQHAPGLVSQDVP